MPEDKVYILFERNLLKDPCLVCKVKTKGLDSCDLKCGEYLDYEAQQRLLKRAKLLNVDVMVNEINKIIRRDIHRAEEVLKRGRKNE